MHFALPVIMLRLPLQFPNVSTRGLSSTGFYASQAPLTDLTFLMCSGQNWPITTKYALFHLAEQSLRVFLYTMRLNI